MLIMIPTLSTHGHPTSVLENICSEDDVRSTIFGKFYLLPASTKIFEHLKNGIVSHLQRIFTLKRSPRISGAFFSG